MLEDYDINHNRNNTCFHDTFPVSETAEFLQNIDIINNLYGNDTLNVQKAISIKLFHALYSRVPILVCPNTYVGEVAKELGMGFDVDDKDIDVSLPDKIFEWYHNIDYKKMVEKGDTYLQEALTDNERFEELFKKYVTPREGYLA